MISSDIYIQRMLSFAQEAGAIALDLISKSDPGLKKDQSVITLADKAISKLARRSLSDFLQNPGHILIDEEDPDIIKYMDQKSLDGASFIWALDPIDGTRLYANRMPLFGISLGLVKDLKPWLGVVYFPMLKELFYCDGKDAYFVRDAFGAQEIKTRIVPVDEELSARSLFFCNDTFFDKFYWKDKDFHIMINACAVVNLCWPAVGRGVGCFVRCHIWDFAGSWPILRCAGIDLRRISDGKILESLEADLFINDPVAWHMKEYYLVTSQRNYQLILSKIVRRTPCKTNI
jgi:fructose-1,6-bisphosphatase/inositol monophosphatase family enzyme